MHLKWHSCGQTLWKLSCQKWELAWTERELVRWVLYSEIFLVNCTSEITNDDVQFCKLPKFVLNLGDACHCFLHVSIGGGITSEGIIYSPYWRMDKTGAKLDYRISNQKTSYFDSGGVGFRDMLATFLPCHFINHQHVAQMSWFLRATGFLYDLVIDTAMLFPKLEYHCWQEDNPSLGWKHVLSYWISSVNAMTRQILTCVCKGTFNFGTGFLTWPCFVQCNHVSC